MRQFHRPDTRCPLIVVSAGPCACKIVDNVNAISSVSTTFAAIEKRVLFTANDLGISSSLLMSTLDPGLGQ
jgi:hypothetical protein